MSCLKSFIPVFFLSLATSIIGQIYVPGTHNGWALDETSEASIMTNFGGSQDYYGITLPVQVDGEFKVVLNAWGTDWGGGYWITGYNQRWTVGYNGANAVWKDSPDTYVHLTIADPQDFTTADLPMGVMTLSAAPVTVTAVSQLGSDSAGTYYAGVDTQIVTITLDQAASPEENNYLRYTTEDWSSDHFALATGSGTTYTAEIPGPLARGTVVEYYVLTTTLTWSEGNDLDTYPDLMTMAYENNGGLNYSYTVNGNNPPVIRQGAGPFTVEEGDTVSFTLTATDLDGDALTWSAENLPAGAQFTDNGDGTAAFFWVPGYAQAGEYEDLRLIVRD